MNNNTIICQNTSCRRNVKGECRKSFTVLDENGKCITEGMEHVAETFLKALKTLVNYCEKEECEFCPVNDTCMKFLKSKPGEWEV